MDKTAKDARRRSSPLFQEGGAGHVHQLDLAAIERELRLKRDDLTQTLSKLEKAKRVSPEILKLKVSI